MAKEVKEMSIESVKKEIVDKLKDNFDILQYLSNHTYTAYNSDTVSSAISSIFNYGTEAGGNYISVEADEHEFSVCNPNDHKRYKVIIKMGLEEEKYLDELASVVKKVITELYPDRKNYSNVSVFGKPLCSSSSIVTHSLNRIITFEIEADTYMK